MFWNRVSGKLQQGESNNGLRQQKIFGVRRNMVSHIFPDMI